MSQIDIEPELQGPFHLQFGEPGNLRGVNVPKEGKGVLALPQGCRAIYEGGVLTRFEIPEGVLVRLETWPNMSARQERFFKKLVELIQRDHGSI